MTAKRSIKDLERQCKKEPDNLVIRLLLAAAYREIGRTTDAIPLYRSVADSYQRLGRKTQAVAVLKSLLELDPVDPETRLLIEQIDRETSAAAVILPPGPPPMEHQERPSSSTGLGSGRRPPPGARVLAEDVVVRELTPVRPPGVPSTARPLHGTPIPPPAPGKSGPSLASTLSGIGTAGPGTRGASPSRGIAATFTPTPLPTPIPFHEADVTGNHERSSSDHDAEDALTRVADGFGPPRKAAAPRPAPARPAAAPKHRPSSTGEITSPDTDIAADLDTRRVRRLTEEELDVVARPPPGATSPISRIETADLDGETSPDARPKGMRDDDEPTRLADDTGAHSGEVEGPTGVRRAAAPARPPSRSAHPVARAAPPKPRPPTTVRAAPAPAPRRPALDVAESPESGDRDLDEPTRVADGPSSRPTAPLPSDRGHLVGVTRPDTQDTDRHRDSGGITRDTGPMDFDGNDEATRASEPGMHRSRTFAAQTFASTLEEMDPDGSAIEAPLDVFSILPADALAELGRRMTLRSYAPGELVIREGEPGDACYVIADGEVRVLKNDPLTPDAGPVEVARLGARSLFGEFALLADRRRHASVQATSHVSVYEIPRALLRELAASYAEVGPALDSFYRQRLLATLLRTAPFFSPLPEDFRARLLARFVPIRADSGEPIVREGQPAGGLYLIIIGAVEITRKLGKHRSVILASLREGAYFGEMSLLSGGPTSATVVAAGPVELALLPPRDFYDVVAEHPQLWALIRREARTRALENAKMLAGETGTV